MRIGVTGADGLLGLHLSCYLKTLPDVILVRANRMTFKEIGSLQAFAASCDVIVHLAGMNRGDDQEVAETNIQLTQELIAACKSSKVSQIIFSSSTHIYRESAYGRSKIKCSQLLSDWASKNKTVFTNIIFPNVYGEGGKPFYNSVVSTFCHQLAKAETPTIVQDSSIELLHAGSAAEEIYSAIRNRIHGDIVLRGTPILVSDLLKKLESFSRSYASMVIPDLRNNFDLSLFNTYRSYLYPEKYPSELVLHTDLRGSFFEVAKDLNGGQTSISTTLPGVTRGNHFHRTKIERFCVIQGDGLICIRKLFSQEKREFQVSGRTPVFLDMPTLHTHNIKNVGAGELLTLFWSNDLFDPKKPDTTAEVV